MDIGAVLTVYDVIELARSRIGEDSKRLREAAELLTHAANRIDENAGPYFRPVHIPAKSTGNSITGVVPLVVHEGVELRPAKKHKSSKNRGQ